MARVACLMMLKNERVLLPRFFAYYAALFGAENLYLFDNGSTDPMVKAELKRAERMGASVERGFASSDDFRRKSTVLGDRIKQLEQDGHYDFYLPLDCDEFVVLRTPTSFTVLPEAIHAYLNGLLGSKNILHVTLNLVNVLGQPDIFQSHCYSKTVWPNGVFHAMDQGFHSGVARGGGSPYQVCELVYAHYHYRPYADVLKFAKQKLRVRLSKAQLRDHDFLRTYQGLGWHMVDYIVNGLEAYYGQFRDLRAPVVLPALRQRFAELGLTAPYENFELPPAAAAPAPPPHLVVDESTTARVRGWALNPSEPKTPLCLCFKVDGQLVWKGICDDVRPDVLAAGYPTATVGFDFALSPAKMADRPRLLTVEAQSGTELQFIQNGSAKTATILALALNFPAAFRQGAT